MKVSPARKAAFDVLLKLEDPDLNSSALLAEREASLEAADAGLCHELTLGVLRRQMLLDAYFEALAGTKKLDIEVRIALRLGLYQIAFLDRIPAHAAVNESVTLVQIAKKRSASGLVNAVLRKATASLPELAFTDEIEKLSIESSHPRELIDRWVKQFGLEETEKLTTANNIPSKLSFRLLVAMDEIREDARNSWQESPIVAGCYRSTSGGRQLLELEKEGNIYFQEEGSQMVAASVTLPDGGRFLDVCAAPGGKTGMILGRSTAFGVAGDITAGRIGFLRDNLGRQKVQASIVQYDAEVALPFAEQHFDSILVDAPCTGTGAISSNPEIRYRVTQDEITRLSCKQLSILKNASKLLKKGGLLVYSTCSLEVEENEAVVETFLAETDEFRRENPVVPESFITPAGYARTFPQRDGMDGFFVAALRRI